MSDSMSINQTPLTLIVAATTANGIGKNGALPWPTLKKEMAYFARVTKRVPLIKHTDSQQSAANNAEEARRNVVIMGRKTWESIPPKFRPLKDRTNVVISTQDRTKLGVVPNDVIVASDITSGLGALGEVIKDGKASPIGRAFIIGGSSIYQAALELAQTDRVLLTRIHKEYDCDTFFPINLGQDVKSNEWHREDQANLEGFIGEKVPEGLVVEGDGSEEVQYEFQLYARP